MTTRHQRHEMLEKLVSERLNEAASRIEPDATKPPTWSSATYVRTDHEEGSSGVWSNRLLGVAAALLVAVLGGALTVAALDSSAEDDTPVTDVASEPSTSLTVASPTTTTPENRSTPSGVLITDWSVGGSNLETELRTPLGRDVRISIPSDLTVSQITPVGWQVVTGLPDRFQLTLSSGDPALWAAEQCDAPLEQFEEQDRASIDRRVGDCAPDLRALQNDATLVTWRRESTSVPTSDAQMSALILGPDLFIPLSMPEQDAERVAALWEEHVIFHAPIDSLPWAEFGDWDVEWSTVSAELGNADAMSVHVYDGCPATGISHCSNGFGVRVQRGTEVDFEAGSAVTVVPLD